MKIKIKILLVCLALVLGLTTAAGCQNDGLDGGSPVAAERPDIYMIEDFETLEDLRGFGYLKTIGKIELNTDPAYIKSGAASARFEIHGNPALDRSQYPAVRIFTAPPPRFFGTATKFALDKTDFTDVDMLNMDIYNASDRDITIIFRFASLARSEGASLTYYGPQRDFTLKKGQWNNISYIMIREAIGLNFDLSKIDTFEILFPNPRKGETKPVLYLDNFTAHKAASDAPAYAAPAHNANEVVTFETEYEVQSAKTRDLLNTPDAMLAHNLDKRYVRNGSASLKITTYPGGRNVYWGNTVDAVSVGYSGAAFGTKDWSNINSVKMPFFNASDIDWIIQVNIGSETADGETANISINNVKLPKGQWTDLEYTKANILALRPTFNFSKVTGVTIAYVGLASDQSPQGKLVFYWDGIYLT
jgi:hypothetical protein